MSAYTDDVTVVVSDTSDGVKIDGMLKEYRVCTDVHINQGKISRFSSGLLKRQSMLTSGYLCCWTEFPVRVAKHTQNG